MKTQKIKQTLKRMFTPGLIGLAALATEAAAETNVVQQTKTSGTLTYFVSKESENPWPNSYAKVNHFTSLPYSANLLGFLELYRGGEGYYGKTVVEKDLTDRTGLSVQAIHINEPITQIGVGPNVTLPTPKGTFVKLTYLPVFSDSRGEIVDNQQILGYYASANLPLGTRLWGFGEINLAGKEGAEWSYGETELTRNIGNRLSVGANLQLTGKGGGKMTPEFIPRLAFRFSF